MMQALSEDLASRVDGVCGRHVRSPGYTAKLEVGTSTAIRWIANTMECDPTGRPQRWRRPSMLMHAKPSLRV